MKKRMSKSKQVSIVIIQVIILTFLIGFAFYVYGKQNEKKAEPEIVEISNEPENKADENGIVWDEKTEQIVKWCSLPVQKDEKNSVKDIVNAKYTIYSTSEGQTADGKNYLKIGFADETNKYSAVFEVSAEQDCLSLFEYYVGDEKVTDITQIDGFKSYLDSYGKNDEKESVEKKKEGEEKKNQEQETEKKEKQDGFIVKYSTEYSCLDDWDALIRVTPTSEKEVKIEIKTGNYDFEYWGEVKSPNSLQFTLDGGENIQMTWSDKDHFYVESLNGFDPESVRLVRMLCHSLSNKRYCLNAD